MPAALYDPVVQELIDGALRSAAREGAQLLPTFAPGCGPYPHCSGRWVHEPRDESHRLAWISLYVALVSDAALELIGARQRIVIEGRFANALGFARALATLRSDMTVFIADRDIDAPLSRPSPRWKSIWTRYGANGERRPRHSAGIGRNRANDGGVLFLSVFDCIVSFNV